jgi:hypothetical protein
MPVVPLRQPTHPEPVTESIEARFRRLETVWRTETAHLSSSTKIIDNHAFQEILQMGASVVPFMIQDLRERPRLWVWALPDLTGVNPVPPSDGGNIGKMTEAWLRWANENGYKS